MRGTVTTGAAGQDASAVAAVVDAAMARAREALAGRQAEALAALAALTAAREGAVAAARAADAGTARRGLEAAARALDDRPRRLLFDALSEVRGSAEEATVSALASTSLGPTGGWIRAYRRHISQRLARAVLIPTWECELRCSYCWIPKQGGRVMTRATAERAVDLLLTAAAPAVDLQFFGGEALLEAELVRHAMDYATARGAEVGKRVTFVLSSNGWSLDAAKLAWLADKPVKLELSLDGDARTQTTYRRSNVAGEDSYTRSIAANVGPILASGLPYDVIMVVQPRTAAHLAHNFFHIVGLGFERVQINFALGERWTPGHITTFASELFAIGEQLAERRARGERVTLVNLENAPMPVRLNGEIHVDWDGTIYGSNGFLNENERKADFVVGHLDDLAGFDRYWLDAPENDFLLERTYPPDITANNLEVGKVLASFVRYLQPRLPPLASGDDRSARRLYAPDLV